MAFSDAFRLMTTLQDSSKLAEALIKQVKFLDETSCKVSGEAEKTVVELTEETEKLQTANASKVSKDATEEKLNNMKEFAKCMRRVASQSSEVSRHCKPVLSHCQKILDFLGSDSDVTAKDVERFVDTLQEMICSAEKLYRLFIDLKEYLTDASKSLEDLRRLCITEADKAGGRAKDTRIGGGIGSGLAGGLAGGLAVAGTFFPPLWIPAAVCGAACVGGGIWTAIDASNLDDVKKGFEGLKNALDNTSKELCKIADDIRASIDASDKLLEKLHQASHRARNLERNTRKAEEKKN